VPETLNAYRADPFSYREARDLVEALEVSEPLAITLVRRGYRTPEEARAFLEADESHPPGAFCSMEAIVERLRAAIADGRRITVHGDFDVDGVCATAILVGALRELGGECDWLIPDRATDGYGLGAANVERLAERGTQLLLTADCGVTARAEVELARSLGMDVVVTDHHTPGEVLPECPILHPALDGYPFAELCGTAVAWKLACAVRSASSAGSPAATSRGVRGDPAPESDLDLVALATVADLVPLVGENRMLVRRGLEEVRRARRPGLRALLDTAQCEPAEVDEGDLAFRLAPRINAAGRLYRADAGVELFLTADRERAREIAEELSRANGERRTVERRVDAEAEAARRDLPERHRDAKALVLAGEGWHPGVVGIVASRLVERHYRPVVVVALDNEGRGRGSGRSIPGFDLLAALTACSEHLVSFGGHRAAAGLELRAERLEAFRDAFAAHADSVLEPEDLVRMERIDAMVGGPALGLDLAEELQRLAPFGMGNPGVRLLVPGASVRDVRGMGGGKHSRFSLHSGAHRAVGVAFGRPNLGVQEGEAVDAAVRLEVNRWNGSVEPRVVLRDLYRRPDTGSGSASAAEDDGGESPATREWWERFEAELVRDPAHSGSASVSPSAGGERARREVRSICPPGAVLEELAACADGEVLAFVADADAEARRALNVAGAELVDPEGLERHPHLARGFGHVVLFDPPAFPHLQRFLSLSSAEGGFLHLVWGPSEHRFALAALSRQLARRPAVAELYRALRETGEVSAGRLFEALRRCDSGLRGPEAAARCFRVLVELELVRGAPDAGHGSVRVVSSEKTELERSAAYRAYGARHQEGLEFLERRRHP
jgi:single-stranded-DNA-specific exonuclease